MTQHSSANGKRRKFIGIHFMTCNTYLRLYPNKSGSHFSARCAKCGLSQSLKIDSRGTNERFFRSTCMRERR